MLPPPESPDWPIGLTPVAEARAQIEIAFGDAPALRDTLSGFLDEAEAGDLGVATFGRAFAGDNDPIYCMYLKGLDIGPTLARCANADGLPVDRDTARLASLERQYAERGSMTPTMATQIANAAPGATFDATVWLRSPAPEPREFLPRDEETFALLEAQREARQAVIADACRALEGVCDVVSQAKIRGPFIDISATAEALRSLAFHPLVGAVEPTADWTQEPGVSDVYLPASYFDAAQALNPPWDGAGSRVAIVEGPRITAASMPAFSGIHDPMNDLYCNASIAVTHADRVGSAVAGDSSFGGTATRVLDGSAPETRLYVANLGSSGVNGTSRNCASSAQDPTCDPNCGFAASVTGAVTWARGELVDVINHSNQGIDDTIPYHAYDRYYDWVGHSHPWPVVVPITGQMPNTTVSRFACSNCIVTGGTDDQETKNRGDDTMYLGEDWANRLYDLEVPHVVAPAVAVRTLANGNWTSSTGTSFAAPQVSGLAASIVGQHQDLKSYPEAIRALILATATQDIDGVPLDVNSNGAGGIGVDDQDGAGAINAFLAAYTLVTGVKNSWAPNEPRGLNFGLLDGSNFNGSGYYNDHLRFVAPSGQKFQATLTWNVSSACSDAATNCPAANAPVGIGNYAIEVYRTPGSQLVASSMTPTEEHNYVHVRLDSLVPGETYSLYIKRVWQNSTPPDYQYFGLAWHTFSPFFE